ncbi:transporter substrate-binding domain-containing protein [Legionella spiritensis]|uniref:Putative amino acid ABC transporter, periplasmic binding protein n=1 Tax=Legionella spiritensis TaxID=452 RepID=A0A0W0Z5B8_LEGSP|nr:transporter substrate-binding domain-containing protein [Legionella spiritensis]KTD64306.1 putative amino acid ABC transporter, periplasmic binding protein [Legionella spiritensis]SNV46739.1 putative amino acid ABC transporter, periplasmic binding protein [Legionella spiritensis]
MKIYRISVILFFIFISPLQAQNNVLKIAVSFYDPPFVIQISDNNFYGFDIAMMEDICKIIGYKCQYMVVPANQLLLAVQKKQADLAISSIIITRERVGLVNFSLPYLVSEARFLGPKKHAGQFFSIDKLHNKKIGISDDAYTAHLNIIGVNNPDIISYDQNDIMIDALHQGKIDFVLVDAPTTHFWNLHSSGALVALGEPMAFGAGLGIAIHPDNRQLLERINHALIVYHNSENFKEDYEKYLINLPVIPSTNTDSYVH